MEVELIASGGDVVFRMVVVMCRGEEQRGIGGGCEMGTVNLQVRV